MSPRLRSYLFQAGGILLAVVLLYFALRGVDFGAVVLSLQQADYRWLVPLVVVGVASSWFRAWRWQVMLESLPDDQKPSSGRVSQREAFYAVMIGYMVNNAAPRLGELVRAGNLARRERLRFSSVLGSVVAERVLDVIVLALALGSVLILVLDRLPLLEELFVAPLLRQAGRFPTLLIGLLAVLLLVAIGLLYRRFARAANGVTTGGWQARVAPSLGAFRDGMATLLRVRKPGALVVSTVGMWACYLLMTYLPLLLLGLVAPYDLSLGDAWVIMILSSLGFVVPSPGGVGSYHYVTRQTLVLLFAMELADAATFAFFTHAAQLILYTVGGFVCLLLQGTSLSALRMNDVGGRRPDPAPATSEGYEP